MEPTKILAIDDEEETCSLLKEFFEGENFIVTCAHNGLDGIAIQKSFKASIIILDLRMPGISGLETLTELKKLGPVSVICVSAVTENGMAEECIKMGASIYMFKPIILKELLAHVKNCQIELEKGNIL
jgi:DNA-binding response OmpR family regulator